MFRRTICLIVVSLLLVSLFVGCNGTADDKSIDDKKSEATTDDKKVESEKKEPVELTFVHYNTEKPERAAFYDEIVEKYMNDHPNVKITIAKTSFKESDKTVLTAISAGKSYDIIHEPISGQRILVDRDIVYDLTDYVKNDEEYMNSLRPGLIDAMQYIDGKIYALPEILDALPLNYHEDLLKDLGFDELPKNREEFFEYLEKAKAEGYTPFQLHGSMKDELLDIFAFQFASKYGVNINDVIAGKVSFNQPWFIDAVTFFKDMYDKGYLPKEFWSIGGTDGRMAYAQGTMPMKMGYFNDVETHKDMGMPYENQGVAVFPNITGDDNITTYRRIKLRSYMVAKDCENPDVAVDFIKYMLNEENQEYNAYNCTGREPNGIPTSNKNVKTSNYVEQYLKEYNAGTPINNTLLGISVKSKELYSTHIPKLMLGEITPEDFAIEMDKLRE